MKNFKKTILEMLLPTLVNALLSTFDMDEIKRELDRFIDRIENRITLSETKADDALLPVLYLIRNAFDIPDYPDDAPAASPKKA